MRARSAWLVAAVILTAGCSATTTPDAGSVPADPAPGGDPSAYTPDLSGVSDEQAAELSDGEVTTDEYSAGFRRYEACLAAAGYQLEDVAVAPSGLVSAGIPDAAVQSGVDRECYTLEWMQLDISWQLAHREESPSNLFRRDCLIQHGIEPGGTAEEIEKQFIDANLDPSKCEG